MEAVTHVMERRPAERTHERILQRTSRIVEQSRQLAVLNHIASSVSRSLDFGHTLNGALEEVLQLMPVDAGWILLHEDHSDFLTLRAHRGTSRDPEAAVERLRASQAFIGAVADGGSPVVGEIPWNAGDALSRLLRRDGFHFFVAIPLRAKSANLGVLLLASRFAHEVDPDATQFLTSVGDVIGVAIENAGLYSDIARLLDESRLQAARLKESEQQFRKVIESATDAVAIIQDDRFVYVNRFGRAMLGYSPEEALDLPFAEMVRADDWDRVHRKQRRSLRGEVLPPLDVTLVRKDRTEMSASLNTCLIEYAGRPALLMIARDITEPKLLREQVIQSEKMAALGQLISGVAHELNNPLTTVIGYSDLMRRSPLLPASLLRDVGTIGDAAQRAGRIVQDLLTFARRHRDGRSAVDINQLLERSISLRAYELRVNNIEVIRSMTDDLPVTLADEYRLQQVFFNLITNAEHAMLKAHGRGRLEVRTRLLGSPEVSGNEPGSQFIEICIADSGPGIEEHLQTRIFEPFFTTKPVGEGTGLGLSISHSLVQDHGGRLFVRSQPGEGATFVIELPVVTKEEPVLSNPPEQPAARNTAGKRILVVDDEPAIANLVKEIVASEEHEVDVVYNGSQALGQLERGCYDLIFCDMRMPLLNGRELFLEIKRRFSDLAARVVFVTGDVVNAETRKFLEEAGAVFIEKPFKPEAIVLVLRKMLARS